MFRKTLRIGILYCSVLMLLSTGCVSNNTMAADAIISPSPSSSSAATISVSDKPPEWSCPNATITPTETKKTASGLPDDYWTKFVEMTESFIFNLPEELYRENNSTYSDTLGYEMILKDPMTFDITVKTSSGSFSLGIKDKSSKEFVFDMKEFTTETATVCLELGEYDIIIKEIGHSGSYHIIGKRI